MAFSAYQLLNQKRRGESLSAEDVAEFVRRFTAGEVADYQMSAFLMAVAIRGMTSEETAALTRAMRESGEQWNLHERFDFLSDKHSTGGVGDKVSMVLTPWVASCGIKIAMLSGRGLGHTGGTLDKLDAIPGFNARLSRAEVERCVEEVGCAIATSTEGVAPADRRMYALRDVTGTVESLPLITASIMSKKLAMGASALILDVKTGSGAFMQELEQSRALARSLIAAAAGSGTRVEALITDMDQPLGIAAGNANEMIECFDVLRGGGPADLREVTRAQAVRLLVMSGQFDEDSAGEALEESIRSGRALEKTREWIAAQGGDPAVVDDPSLLAAPEEIIEIGAERSGFVAAIDAYQAGMLAVDLGAGRKKSDDPIDYGAGIYFDRKVGDEVRAGEVVARIATGPRSPSAEEIRERYRALLNIADEAPPSRPLVRELITG